MVPADGSPHAAADLFEGGGVGRALDLERDHHLLLFVQRDREGRRDTRAKRSVARLGALLEILRVVVLPGDDEQVLAPAGHEELAAEEKAEVPGSQEAGGRVAQRGAEGRRGLTGPVPVPAATLGPESQIPPTPPSSRGARVS